MNRTLIIVAVVLVAVLLVAVACSTPEPAAPEARSTAQTPAPLSPPPAHGPARQAAPSPDPSLPPYHESAEAARPFPRLMPASRYRDYPLVARAYEIAAQIPAVLAQQPCYCHCDKFGHGSLLDCYASDHGAG